MAQRDPLNECERRKLQREYHKGMDAQKRIIQCLFGEDVTYSSGMARSNSFINEQKARQLATQIGSAITQELGSGTIVAGPFANLTEEEFWDWVCRAAWHGQLWDHPSFGNGIPFWIEVHRQYAGWGFRIREHGKSVTEMPDTLPPLENTDSGRTYSLLVPDPIPHTCWTKSWQAAYFLVTNTVKGLTAIIYATLGGAVTLLLERALVN